MDTFFQSGLRHILVPTNFSKTAGAALEYGCQLAQAFSAQLTLLHVTDVARMSRTPAGLDAIDHLYDVFKLPPDEGRVISAQHSVEHLAAKAERRLLQAVPEEWRGQIDVQAVAVPGRPLPEIVKFADAHESDLIIMGTHHRLSLSRWLRGSLADSVVRQVACPVLVVQPETSRRPFAVPTGVPLPQPSMS